MNIIDGEISVDFVDQNGTDIPALLTISNSTLGLQFVDKAGGLAAEVVIEIYEGKIRVLTWDASQVGGDPTITVIGNAPVEESNPASQFFQSGDLNDDDKQ